MSALVPWVGFDWTHHSAPTTPLSSLAPRDDHSLNLLGTLLQQQPGRSAEAAAAYRRAIGARPSSGDAYHNLGTVHQRLGRLEEARAMYELALPLAPNVPNVYISLASLEQPPRNAALLRQALDLEPTSPEAYQRLAAALAPVPLGAAEPPSESKARAAIRALSAAASLSPRDAHTRSELGRLRLGLAAALVGEAAADYAEAAELQRGGASEAKALNHAGLLQRAAGRAPAAVRLLEEGMERAVVAAGRAPGSAAFGALDWRVASRQLRSAGYYVADGVLGAEWAREVEATLRETLPHMKPGRVGAGLTSDSVRSDWLWRHRREERSVVDPDAGHVRALHAVFDAVPLGLNRVGGGTDGGGGGGSDTCGGGGGSCRDTEIAISIPASLAPRGGEEGASAGASSWALTHAEDLQFACYRPEGFYRRHSDAQHASRRVLTAIYYVNTGWLPAHGGKLRLHLPGGATHDVEPRADRLLLFDSRLEHEVLPMAADAAKGAKRRTSRGGQQLQSEEERGAEGQLQSEEERGAEGQPPRCAVTQWFQDLAPPLLATVPALGTARPGAE